MEIVKHVDDEDKGMSSDTLVDSFDVKMDSDSDSDMDDLDPYADHRMSCSSSGSDSSGSDSDSDSDFAPSKWLDKEVTSTVEVGLFKITREVTVDCIEYLSALPSYWPVPRDNRAYLIDLSSPKFDLKDKHGKLLPVDTLIKNADQDSWKGCTGGGVKDSHPLTTIFSTSDDDEPICCRRSRLKCRGCFACEKVNPEMLSQERYEPDANILESIIKLQFETRSKEADSAEKLALIFFAICHSITCPAKNKQGEKCDGIPILQKFTNGPQHGHKYFIGCSKWTKETRHDHSYSFIPNGVHDKDLDVLFKGGFLQDSGFLCGRIFPAHIGAKASHCKFPHNGDGTKAKVKQYKCPASRTIFVPEDPTIRKACVVPNYKQPHNHPVLPPSKTPLLVKEAYKACIEKVGLIGATVRTIDNAPTTRLAREEDPSLLAAPLQNQRVKQDIIRALKKAEFPEGMNLAGVIRVLQEDLKKPLRERYIHGFTTTATGGQVIITANAILLDRIHSAKSIFVDTTFKRTVGSLKEWEVAMYDVELQRALTIARVYSDRADRLQYKTIFDELQRVTFLLTGKHLRLKRLSKDGTLISIGVDLELAQALGAGDSFLPTNEPEFSGIHAMTAEELIEYFIHACYTHATRGVEDLKPHVTDEQFSRLRNFLYMETKEEVDKFSEWIKSLNIPKVQAWWDHKVVNTWILPALIKCLSKINPDDWDITASTTNVGESQHHYTNINTGIKLSLLEAILTARKLDEDTAAQLKQSAETGVLKTTRGDTATRLSRSTTRVMQAHKKSTETRQMKKAVNAVDEELQSLQKSQKEHAAKIKELKVMKASLALGNGKGKSSKAESNSSGKVTGVSRQARAKTSKKVASVKEGAVERQQNNKFKPATTHAPIFSTATSTLLDSSAPSSALSLLTAESVPPTTTTSLADVTSQANLFTQTLHTTAPMANAVTSLMSAPSPPPICDPPLPSAILSTSGLTLPPDVLPMPQWHDLSNTAQPMPDFTPPLYLPMPYLGPDFIPMPDYSIPLSSHDVFMPPADAASALHDQSDAILDNFLAQFGHY
ncbi:hypothetical protein CPB84DRAFT_1703009 [Gymnopilus junonius]|uniref:Uncharacterized protein n=1 Tax=Gymnopilus junonius TaxID=109634 RepID=A0A9P5NYZ6_GYMJU|nr:hypothetical protein CPB84DRAFT_1703009 [Gymnopilus junonius]